MRNGTLKWFDDAKGYGFIVPDDGGEDVFVRKAALDAAGIKQREAGTKLHFNVSRSSDGLQATDLGVIA